MFPYFILSWAIIGAKIGLDNYLQVDHPVTLDTLYRVFYLPEAGYFLWFVYVLFLIFCIVPFFKPGKRVVDLGCAPGGWTQVAVARNKGSGQVVGIDILETTPINGATLICQDFTGEDAPDKLKALLNGKADIVMSDMAANTTGIPSVDHLRTMNLIELAYDFALQVLVPGGWFIAKIFAGGTDNQFLAQMKKNFQSVKHVKPPASRKDSVEYYVVAKGFKCTPNK